MLGFFGPVPTLGLSGFDTEKIPTVWLLPRQLPALMTWSAKTKSRPKNKIASGVHRITAKDCEQAWLSWHHHRAPIRTIPR